MTPPKNLRAWFKWKFRYFSHSDLKKYSILQLIDDCVYDIGSNKKEIIIMAESLVKEGVLLKSGAYYISQEQKEHLDINNPDETKDINDKIINTENVKSGKQIDKNVSLETPVKSSAKSRKNQMNLFEE